MPKRPAYPFDAEAMPMETTLARQISKQNLTELNDAYWVSERGHSLLHRSFAKIKMPTDPTAHGAYGTDKQWSDATNVQREWMRRHVVFSSASLLETYVVSAAATSFWAKPELIDRSLAGLRMGSFIKHPNAVPPHFKTLVKKSTERISKGTWKERFVAMAAIFGKLPVALISLESSLQLLESRRNKISHAFGADGDLPKTPWEQRRSISVTTSYINDVFVNVNSFIRIADENVFGPRIGGYEMLHEFQVWAAKQPTFTHMSVTGTLERTFRKHVGESFGNTPGKDYFTALIRHFESL
jgi:hypothetical protein